MRFNLPKVLELAKSDNAQITIAIMGQKMADFRIGVRGRYSRKVTKVIHTYIDQVRWDTKLLILTYAWQIHTGHILNDDLDIYCFMMAYDCTCVKKFWNMVYEAERSGVLYA